METFLEYYLPVFLLFTLVVTFILPSVRVYSKTGINPVTFGKSGNAHDYIGFVMKVLTSLLLCTVFAFSLSKQVYQYLVPIPYLEIKWLKYTGLFLVHASFVWTVIAQFQMKTSWRIGVDVKNKTELVTLGLFQFSRNPIFFGMILSTVGIFLIIPNAVILSVTGISYVVIQIQIRIEEEYLSKQHGTIYETYKRSVRRFL